MKPSVRHGLKRTLADEHARRRSLAQTFDERDTQERIVALNTIEKTFTAEDTATDLNQLLADYKVFDQKLRNYHWNVRGKRFFQLHETFEAFYGQTAEFTDAFAERIMRLGGRPLNTLTQYVERSRLEEDPRPGSADQMVRTLVRDIEALNRATIEVIERADERKDVATTNILKDVVAQQEENAWMLSSWLNE